MTSITYMHTDERIRFVAKVPKGMRVTNATVSLHEVLLDATVDISSSINLHIERTTKRKAITSPVEGIQLGCKYFLSFTVWCGDVVFSFDRYIMVRKW